MTNLTPIVIVGAAPDAEAELKRLRHAVICFDQHANEDLITAAARRARLLILGAGAPQLLSAAGLSNLRESNPGLAVLQLVHAREEQVGLVDRTFVLPNDRADFSSALQLELKQANVYGARNAAFRSLLRALLTIVVLVGVWHFGVQLLNLPPYLVPAPLRVLDAFAARPASFISHFGITASEALAGFIIANIIGGLSTVVLYRFQLARSIVMPVFVAIQAVPIMALAPLLVVWLGTGVASKIVMAGIICFFPIVINAMQSFSAMEQDFIQLFRFHQASYLATLRHLLIPASRPAIIAALRISGALAVVGAVVAEFTGANAGLGYLLLTASYRLETDIMFVAIILCAILGIGFFHAPLLLARAVAWRRRQAPTTHF